MLWFLRTLDNQKGAGVKKSPMLCGQYPVKSEGKELKIVVQPETQHRARYLTEGSRGSVKDRTQQGFPTVKVLILFCNVWRLAHEMTVVKGLFTEPEENWLYLVVLTSTHPCHGTNMPIYVFPTHNHQINEYVKIIHMYVRNFLQFYYFNIRKSFLE